MARYKEYDYSQGKFIPIHFDRQILPGTFDEEDRLPDLRTTEEMFEESGSHGSETGLLLTRAVGEEARDLHTEDETQDRFDKRQTHLQQETGNGRTCIWEYLFYIRDEQIYPSREKESKHPVVALLCGA